MSEIKRISCGARMSQAVVFNGVVSTAGQVGEGATVAEQTTAILAQIDALLAEAGTSKEKALTATIWLCSMDDFAEVNGVWDAWVAPGCTPTRACVESPRLAAAQYRVEIQLTAAL